MKLHLLLCVLFFSFNSFASQRIKTFDIMTYSPMKKGLKDLYFEVENNKLQKMVESSTGLKLSEPIRFKVYWMPPNKTKIDIVGLPAGYQELEQNLKKIALEVVDYVIPRSPVTVFNEFKFAKEEINKTGVIIRGKSKNTESKVSELELHFSKNDKLLKMISLGAYSRTEVDFDYSKKKYSDNKFLTDSLITTITSGKVKLRISKHFSYIQKDGYAFPSKVKVHMSPVGDVKAKGNSSEMTISGYKANEGFALKRFSAKK